MARSVAQLTALQVRRARPNSYNPLSAHAPPQISSSPSSSSPDPVYGLRSRSNKKSYTGNLGCDIYSIVTTPTSNPISSPSTTRCTLPRLCSHPAAALYTCTANFETHRPAPYSANQRATSIVRMNATSGNVWMYWMRRSSIRRRPGLPMVNGCIVSANERP